MDIKATIDKMCELIAQRDYDELKHTARDAEQWLIKGGFYPDLDKTEVRILISALIDLSQLVR